MIKSPKLFYGTFQVECLVSEDNNQTFSFDSAKLHEEASGLSHSHRYNQPNVPQNQLCLPGQQGNTAQNENGQTANQSNLSIQVGMGGQISNNFLAEFTKISELLNVLGKLI